MKQQCLEMEEYFIFLNSICFSSPHLDSKHTQFNTPKFNPFLFSSLSPELKYMTFI